MYLMVELQKQLTLSQVQGLVLANQQEQLHSIIAIQFLLEQLVKEEVQEHYRMVENSIFQALHLTLKGILLLLLQPL
jgi:hypothetical protein